MSSFEYNIPVMGQRSQGPRRCSLTFIIKLYGSNNSLFPSSFTINIQYLYLFMQYSAVTQYMYTMWNDQIKEISISIISNINHSHVLVP